MKKMIMALVMLFLSISLCSATTIEIKEIGNYWSVDYQGIDVRYNKETCGSLGKNALLNVAHDSEVGVFEWGKMQNSRFRTRVLRTECKRLQKEMISRGLMDTILNKEVK